MSWITALPWSKDEVIELIKTGECATRSANSCRVMRHRLRHDALVQERYADILAECATQGFSLTQVNTKRYTDAELELIKQHIVPRGRSKFSCMLKMTELKLSDVHNKQPWRYEDTRIAPVPITEKITQESMYNNLDLTMKAVKSLISTGMDKNEISKVLKLDVETIDAICLINEKFV